jgi:NADP-dependent 3-hydroxy acid dehydrogenase YdfG
MEQMYIKEKNILITGASKGIGKTLALELSKYACNLILFARTENELKAIQEKCIGRGSKCIIFLGDISNANFVENSIESVIKLFGHIDFLINNAGLGEFGEIETMQVEQFDLMFNTNVKGTFLMTKYILPFMKNKQSGHIISVISDVGKRSIEYGSLYCSSKFAQEAFTSSLRKEVRESNIKVSNIYSGLVDSDFHNLPQGSKEHATWLKTIDMAKSIIFVMNQDKHVVIDELMIHPISQNY